MSVQRLHYDPTDEEIAVYYVNRRETCRLRIPDFSFRAVPDPSRFQGTGMMRRSSSAGSFYGNCCRSGAGLERADLGPSQKRCPSPAKEILVAPHPACYYLLRTTRAVPFDKQQSLAWGWTTRILPFGDPPCRSRTSEGLTPSSRARCFNPERIIHGPFRPLI